MIYRGKRNEKSMENQDQIKEPRVEDQHRSEEHAYLRSSRVLEYRHSAMRARLACHGQHCTVLRVRFFD